MGYTKADFTYQYNADGAMIYYKGKPIGGFGVILPRLKPLHWRHARANCKDNKESCERSINDIISGRGERRYLDAISKIEKGD